MLDAAGRDPIFIETVGVGQDEVEVVGVADLSIVVLVPGMGDDVQTLKAGIMEIADIFVINKCDHPGADQVERSLEAVLSLADRARPQSIVRTIASEGTGVDELVAAIDSASENADRAEERRERHRRAAEHRLRALIEERLVERALGTLESPDRFQALVNAVAAHEKDPYSAVDEVLQHVRFGEKA